MFEHERVTVGLSYVNRDRLKTLAKIRDQNLYTLLNEIIDTYLDATTSPPATEPIEDHQPLIEDRG